MSLLTEIDELLAVKRECLVAGWEQTLSPAVLAEVDEAVESTHPMSVIYEALLRREGKLPFSVDTFTRHYLAERVGGRRRCACRS